MYIFLWCVFQKPKDATTLAPLCVMLPEWLESIQHHRYGWCGFGVSKQTNIWSRVYRIQTSNLPNSWLQKLRVGIGSTSLICGPKLVPWFLNSLMTMFFSGKKHHPSRCLVSGLKTKPCSWCVTKLSKKTCHFGMGPNTMAIHGYPCYPKKFTKLVQWMLLEKVQHLYIWWRFFWAT